MHGICGGAALVLLALPCRGVRVVLARIERDGATAAHSRPGGSKLPRFAGRRGRRGLPGCRSGTAVFRSGRACGLDRGGGESDFLYTDVRPRRGLVRARRGRRVGGVAVALTSEQYEQLT